MTDDAPDLRLTHDEIIQRVNDRAEQITPLWLALHRDLEEKMRGQDLETRSMLAYQAQLRLFDSILGVAFREQS